VPQRSEEEFDECFVDESHLGTVPSSLRVFEAAVGPNGDEKIGELQKEGAQGGMVQTGFFEEAGKPSLRHEEEELAKAEALRMLQQEEFFRLLRETQRDELNEEDDEDEDEEFEDDDEEEPEEDDDEEEPDAFVVKKEHEVESLAVRLMRKQEEEEQDRIRMLEVDAAAEIALLQQGAGSQQKDDTKLPSSSEEKVKSAPSQGATAAGTLYPAFESINDTGDDSLLVQDRTETTILHDDAMANEITNINNNEDESLLVQDTTPINLHDDEMIHALPGEEEAERLYPSIASVNDIEDNEIFNEIVKALSKQVVLHPDSDDDMGDESLLVQDMSQQQQEGEVALYSGMESDIVDDSLLVQDGPEMTVLRDNNEMLDASSQEEEELTKRLYPDIESINYFGDESLLMQDVGETTRIQQDDEVVNGILDVLSQIDKGLSPTNDDLGDMRVQDKAETTYISDSKEAKRIEKKINRDKSC